MDEPITEMIGRLAALPASVLMDIHSLVIEVESNPDSSYVIKESLRNITEEALRRDYPQGDVQSSSSSPHQ